MLVGKKRDNHSKLDASEESKTSLLRNGHKWGEQEISTQKLTLLVREWEINSEVDTIGESKRDPL